MNITAQAKVVALIVVVLLLILAVVKFDRTVKDLKEITMVSQTEPTVLRTPITATKNGITTTTDVETTRADGETAAAHSLRQIEAVETHVQALIDAGYTIQSSS